jgi:putative chitinase
MIKELQTKLGLTPDGVFGPKTLKAAAAYFKLSNLRAAHFFGQIAHETGNFKVSTENLNYSAEGLLKTFGKYFTPETAKAYARQPERIANLVYGNRMGNVASGDGYKYRGRGAIQLTGRANYEAFAKYINRPDVVTNPDIVATELAFESALFFFDKLWAVCDTGDVLAVTKRVNGGTNGLADRKAYTEKFLRELK